MATNMEVIEQYSEIFLTDLEGKQSVVRFLKEQFRDTTIYSLKFQIELKTQVIIQEQSLSFEGRKLDFKRGDKVMTFEDYGIMNGANIIMDQRLMGGKLDAFDFTNVHKKKKFKENKLVLSTITWREVKPGICFVGVCVENDCKARNDIVVINRGFNEYGFVLNYVVHHLNCPKCEKEINTKILQGIGLYKCKATIETMRKLKDGKKQENKYDIESKEFVWAYSLNDKGKITYQYIAIKVKPLDDK